MNLRALLHGIAKSIDLLGVSGRYRNARELAASPAQQARADAKALASDWQIVGQHLWAAMGTIPASRGADTRASPVRMAGRKPPESQALPDLAEEAKRRQVNLLGVLEVSGPLPPPQVLEHYERVLPGSAQRLLTMAEEQSRHRMRQESRDHEADIRQTWVGMFLGFGIGLAVSPPRDSARTWSRSRLRRFCASEAAPAYNLS
jgi:hypothetical protein